MTTKTFSIRNDLVGKVENVIARLNRRAVKLSVEPITFVKTAPVLTEIKTDDTESVWVEMVSVTLSLNIPKLADWTFVATIQHMDGGNLLLTVPGTEGLDLSAYRTCGPVCTHCNLERNRADTYLVRHQVSEETKRTRFPVPPDGGIKQVGKNCLADFTGFGKTPEQAAALAEWLSAVATFCDDPSGDDGGGEGGCGSAPQGVSLNRFLAHVVAVSEKVGFRTRKQSEATGKNSTKEDAIFNMEPPKNYPRHKLVPVEDSHTAFAAEARAWAAAIEPKNDFDHNLRVIATGDGVLYRNLGIAAYVVEAYRRHLGIIAERAARPVSVHFGTEKERLRKLKLTYKGNFSFDSQFGTTFIHRFVTEEGFDAIWKTGSLALCHEGETVTVDATVKKHGDYKGRLQTELTRVKLLA